MYVQIKFSVVFFYNDYLYLYKKVEMGGEQEKDWGKEGREIKC